MTKNLEYQITEKQLFSALNRQSRKSLINDLEFRLKKLKRCNIDIIHKGVDGELRRYFTTSLIL
ncbi:hypothetical protein NBRC116592_06230 [Colwellia sp. KU-HH00111]|uniref:hypothetical protein n=1 Tax=Colwellia sp. KU-HH00111 TaxID=3127652 RepID=UPI003108954C